LPVEGGGTSPASPASLPLDPPELDPPELDPPELDPPELDPPASPELDEPPTTGSSPTQWRIGAHTTNPVTKTRSWRPSEEEGRLTLPR